MSQFTIFACPEWQAETIEPPPLTFVYLNESVVSASCKYGSGKVP